MVHRFGPYEFDPAELELREGTTRKALTPALNRLLLLLVTNQGELVTREQIADVLWESQETVDTVAGINTAMRRLRTTIGDNNGHGIFIQTVVGVGYRFVAPVLATQEAIGVPASVQLSASRRKSSWHKFLLMAAGAALITGIYWWVFGARPVGQGGNSAVAMPIEAMRPVTFDDAEDKLTAGAISPSGTYLAFADSHGVTIQTLATGERKVVTAFTKFSVGRLAWFGDETAVLVSAATQPTPVGERQGVTNSGVWVLPLDNQEPKKVLADSVIAAPSPDGRHLAYLRNGDTEIWISDMWGGAPRKLVQATGGDTFTYLLWSPHGDSVLVDRAPPDFLSLAGAGVVATPPNGSQANRHRDNTGAYEVYDSQSGALSKHYDNIRFSSAAMSHDGLLILCLEQIDGTSRLASVKTDPRSGAFLHQPVLLQDDKSASVEGGAGLGISMTLSGRLLAMILERKNVDVFTADLRNLTLRDMTTPSPVIVHIERLSRHSFGAYPTSWTPDSSAVVFDSGVNGPISVFEQSAVDANPHALVRARSPADKFAQARFSPDGHWLLYVHFGPRSDAVAAIERMPAAGGSSEVVATTGRVEGFRCSIAAAGRCVLREIGGDRQFVYYELDPVRGMGRELVRTPLATHVLGDWSVSPDGKLLAVANHDPAHPSIRLMPLSGMSVARDSTAGQTEVTIPGHGTVLSQSWAKDGQNLFVETLNGKDYELLYASLRGRLTLLQKSTGLIWASPSPDGRKIAFPMETPSSHNVWLGDLKSVAQPQP